MDEMFENLKTSNATAAVFLKNGVRLTGKIIKIDKESILMTSQSKFGLAVARDSIATAQEYSQNSHHERR
jgi:RNA chaperone Hfq